MIARKRISHTKIPALSRLPYGVIAREHRRNYMMKISVVSSKWDFTILC
jgi:hypothetical protein